MTEVTNDYQEEIEKKFKNVILEQCQILKPKDILNEDKTEKKLEDFDKTTRHDALNRWFCKIFLNISDDDIEEALAVSGKGDKGIDFFHKEDDETLVWGQGKFSTNLKYDIKDHEIQKLGETIKKLDGTDDVDNASLEFKECKRIFEETIKANPDVTKKLFFIAAGKLGDENTDEGKEWEKLKDKYQNDSTVEIEIFGIEDLLAGMRDSITPDIDLDFVEQPIKKIDAVTNHESYFGFIKASQLKERLKKSSVKNSLFSLNPRLELGKSGKGKSITMKPITKTLGDEDDKKRFWKWNNGITALCQNIVTDNGDVNGTGTENIVTDNGDVNGTGTENNLEFTYENMKIVNGRQTTAAIQKFTGALDEVEIPISIHKVENVLGEEGTKISETTNTQNPIDILDLLAFSEELKTLQLKLGNTYQDKFYLERQTIAMENLDSSCKDACARSFRFLGKDELLRAIVAYYDDDTSKAMLNQEKLYEINQKTGERTKISGVLKNLTAEEIVIPIIFKKIILELYKKWNKETQEDPPVKTHYRDKLILNKKVIKNYLLRLLNDTLKSMTDDERKKIKEKLIEYWLSLKKDSVVENAYLNIIVVTLDTFMDAFDKEKAISWKGEDEFEAWSRGVEAELKKVYGSNENQIKKDGTIGLSDSRIMYKMKKNGGSIYASVFTRIGEMMSLQDKISDALKAIIAPATPTESKDGENGTEKDESESDAKDGENGTEKDESESDAKEEHT